uniref:Uncharacterized protein n=1 Tax=Anguilla anguilla TaxID=7936 RepID=A0A0E9V420_ANGAN
MFGASLVANSQIIKRDQVVFMEH